MEKLTKIESEIHEKLKEVDELEKKRKETLDSLDYPLCYKKFGHDYVCFLSKDKSINISNQKLTIDKGFIIEFKESKYGYVPKLTTKNNINSNSVEFEPIDRSEFFKILEDKFNEMKNDFYQYQKYDNQVLIEKTKK